MGCFSSRLWPEPQEEISHKVPGVTHPPTHTHTLLEFVKAVPENGPTKLLTHTLLPAFKRGGAAKSMAGIERGHCFEKSVLGVPPSPPLVWREAILVGCTLGVGGVGEPPGISLQ